MAEGRALAQGLGPVPENVDVALGLASAAGAAQAAETPGYLKEAVEKAGFGPALLRTLQDLGGCSLGPEDLERLAPGSADAERLRLLARTARDFGARLETARLLDRPSIYRLAAEALPSPAIGGVVLLGFDDPPPVAADFLVALRKSHPFAVVPETGPLALAPRHDARRRAFLERLAVPAAPEERARAELVAPAGPAAPLRAARGPPAARRPSTRPSTSSPPPGRRWRRWRSRGSCSRRLGEGLRPGQAAVLLRDPARYAAPLASAFERAGIPAYFVEGEPRVDPAAQGLGLLLGLVGGDLERRAVMEFLTTARIPWEGLLGKDAEISASRWDRLSAQAGIVSGIDSWRTRLAEARKKREERGFEDDRDLRLHDSLARLVERLHRDLAAFPSEGGWDDFLGATLGLLDAWIGRGRLVRERLERVLAPLGRFAPAPTREAFLARVRELLATQVYREGSLEDDRVLVSSIDGARGLGFRLVFVPGLVERAFPTVARPDPLLLDEEREALSPELRTTRDAQERERLLFARAVRAAGERLVLSFPRFDTGSGRERVPSSFLLQAVEAAMGRRVAAAELLALASPGETGLGRPHPGEPDAAIDRIERDLAVVAGGRAGAARHLLDGDGFVAASIALERAAWEPRLTPFDGLVDLGGDEAAIGKLAPGGRRSSATEVQNLAACPYKHLLKRGFRPAALGGAGARLPARRAPLRLALPRRGRAPLHAAPRGRPPAGRADAAAGDRGAPPRDRGRGGAGGRGSRGDPERGAPRPGEGLDPLRLLRAAAARGGRGRRLRARGVRAAVRGGRGAARRRADDLLRGLHRPGRPRERSGEERAGGGLQDRQVPVEGGRAVPGRARAAARDLQPRGGQGLRGRVGERGGLLLRDPGGALQAEGLPRERRRWTRRSSASCGRSTRRRARASSRPWPTRATSATSRPSAAGRARRGPSARRPTPASPPS